MNILKVGRDPNTDQNVQMLHYKQRKNAGELLKIQNESKRLLKEAFDVEYDIHIKQAQLEKQIQIRVQKKLHEFDKSIERRRERCFWIFWFNIFTAGFF